MKILLHILVSAAILAGCVTERKRQRICATCPVVSHSKDSIVVKNVTVTVKVPGAPGPTLYLENPCQRLCDSLGNLRPVSFTTASNGQTLHVSTLGGGLLLQAVQGDKTVAAQVPTTERYNKTEKAAIKWMPCQNERTAFDGFTRWYFYITAPILGFFIGRAYLRLQRGRPP